MSSSSSASDEGPKLPHDVAVEVLKQLPVRSLLRCRCVYRSWRRAAIDDPRFAALHLRHSACHASNRYVVSIDWRDPVHSLHSPISDPSQVEIPFVTPPPDGYRVVGSCNGLICITEISRNVCDQTTYLWNLFTRKHKVVRLPGREPIVFQLFCDQTTYLGHPDLHSNCSVWVTRDYGVPESWTKLFTFEASGLVYGFDGFTWNGELMVEIDSGERVSWNPITGQFAELPLWTTCDLVPVIESLVSL